MEKIIEKYRKLHDECKKYQKLDLGTRKNVKANINCAKNGFIETFCMDEYEQNLLNDYRKRLIKSKIK